MATGSTNTGTPEDRLESTSREIQEVQAQIDALRQEAAAGAVDVDTCREIDASHALLHCKLLEDQQSQLMDALAESPDDEALMHSLKAVSTELAAALRRDGDGDGGGPGNDEAATGGGRRAARARADSERLANIALQAERDDLEEGDRAARPAGRALERTRSATLRRST
eukprot:COSAG06_NODE_9573_length_1867_cov_1.553733_1_plen_168_part_10